MTEDEFKEIRAANPGHRCEMAAVMLSPEGVWSVTLAETQSDGKLKVVTFACESADIAIKCLESSRPEAIAAFDAKIEMMKSGATLQ